MSLQFHFNSTLQQVCCLTLVHGGSWRPQHNLFKQAPASFFSAWPARVQFAIQKFWPSTKVQVSTNNSSQRAKFHRVGKVCLSHSCDCDATLNGPSAQNCVNMKVHDTLKSGPLEGRNSSDNFSKSIKTVKRLLSCEVGDLTSTSHWSQKHPLWKRKQLFALSWKKTLRVTVNSLNRDL